MINFTVREYAFISVFYKGCPESNIDHAYIPEEAFEHLCKLSASFSKHGATRCGTCRKVGEWRT